MFNKVDRAAIQVLATKYQVPVEWALGLAEVESAGRAFWSVGGRNVPAINLEGHYFHRHLPVAKRASAVARGLAHPTARKTAVPSSFAGRYKMLADWREIDEDAALMSISMGVGQVMGAHYARLGFSSPRQMWDVACASLAGQVDLMLRFLVTDATLLAAVRRNDYPKVAHLYNGPAYRTNQYDTKIEKAVQKYRGNPAAKPQYDTTAERASIKSLGFDSVGAFQREHGLDPDGIIGPITRDAITNALASAAAPKKAATAAVGTAVVGAGTTAVLTEATGAVTQLQVALGYVKAMGTYGPTIAGAVVLAVVVGTVAYFVLKQRFDKKIVG